MKPLMPASDIQSKDAQTSRTGKVTNKPSKTPLDWRLISRFLTYLKPYRKNVIIGTAFVPISILCSILFPWLIMSIIDDQIVPGKVGGLYQGAGFLVLVLLGNYLADAVFSYTLQNSALHALRDMRKDMFSRILHFPRRYFDKTPMGVTLTRLTSDLEAVNESFAQGLLSMIRDVLTTLALLIFLFVINWKLALMVLVLGPPTYLITEFLRRRLRDAFAKSRVILAQGTGYLQECLNGIKTVQLNSAENEVQTKYKGYTFGFYKAQSRSNFYDSALFAIIEGITTVAMALIIWLGAKEILAATITYGVLIGFTQTLDRIFVPIRDFTSQIASIQRALAALGHIEEIFLQPVEDECQQKPVTGKFQNRGDQSSAIEDFPHQERLQTFHSLAFNKVSFRYSADGPLVLDSISFLLNKGDKFALVGSTGSGKSTILRLLTRAYDNYQGSITLNGIELRTIPIKVVGKFFSLMQQEVFLFNKSIEFNISLGRETINHKDVVNAARYVYADDFIEKLAKQYQFKLQDNGNNLSAGQGQLIAFARAIASGSEVILLDEATSSVDSMTEQLIQKAIDHVFMEKTVIAIAHRLSTIQHSDQILVLDKGKIIERGTHIELVALQAVYANLLKEITASDNSST